MWHRKVSRCAGIALGAFTVAVLSASLHYPPNAARRLQSEQSRIVSLAPPCLTPSNHIVDIGIVPKGTRHAQVFSVTNHCATALTVQRFRTSCDCVELQLARPTVGPGETVLCIARIDLRESIDFQGGLAVDAVGLAASGAELVKLEIRAQVEPIETFSGLSLDLDESILVASSAEAAR